MPQPGGGAAAAAGGGFGGALLVELFRLGREVVQRLLLAVARAVAAGALWLQWARA